MISGSLSRNDDSELLMQRHLSRSIIFNRPGDVPHEGLLKVERLEFRCLGFRVQGSKFGFGVWGLGFRCSGVQVFRCLDTQHTNTRLGLRWFGLSSSGKLFGLSRTGPKQDWPQWVTAVVDMRSAPLSFF